MSGILYLPGHFPMTSRFWIYLNSSWKGWNYMPVQLHFSLGQIFVKKLITWPAISLNVNIELLDHSYLDRSPASFFFVLSIPHVKQTDLNDFLYFKSLNSHGSSWRKHFDDFCKGLRVKISKNIFHENSNYEQFWVDFKYFCDIFDRLHRCWWQMLEIGCVGDRFFVTHIFKWSPSLSHRYNDVTNITDT